MAVGPRVENDSSGPMYASKSDGIVDILNFIREKINTEFAGLDDQSALHALNAFADFALNTESVGLHFQSALHTISSSLDVHSTYTWHVPQGPADGQTGEAELGVRGRRRPLDPNGGGKTDDGIKDDTEETFGDRNTSKDDENSGAKMERNNLMSKIMVSGIFCSGECFGSRLTTGLFLKSLSASKILCSNF